MLSKTVIDLCVTCFLTTFDKDDDDDDDDKNDKQIVTE